RQAALTAAKQGRRVTPATCTSPVARHYDIGRRVGLTGTPMIVTADGTQMPGYMPPADLRAALDRLAADAAPASAPQPAADGAAGSRRTPPGPPASLQWRARSTVEPRT